MEQNLLHVQFLHIRFINYFFKRIKFVSQVPLLIQY